MRQRIVLGVRHPDLGESGDHLEHEPVDGPLGGERPAQVAHLGARGEPGRADEDEQQRTGAQREPPAIVEQQRVAEDGEHPAGAGGVGKRRVQLDAEASDPGRLAGACVEGPARLGIDRAIAAAPVREHREDAGGAVLPVARGRAAFRARATCGCGDEGRAVPPPPAGGELDPPRPDAGSAHEHLHRPRQVVIFDFRAARNLDGGADRSGDDAHRRLERRAGVRVGGGLPSRRRSQHASQLPERRRLGRPAGAAGRPVVFPRPPNVFFPGEGRIPEDQRAETIERRPHLPGNRGGRGEHRRHRAVGVELDPRPARQRHEPAPRLSGEIVPADEAHRPAPPGRGYVERAIEPLRCREAIERRPSKQQRHDVAPSHRDVSAISYLDSMRWTPDFRRPLPPFRTPRPAARAGGGPRTRRSLAQPPRRAEAARTSR